MGYAGVHHLHNTVPPHVLKLERGGVSGVQQLLFVGHTRSDGVFNCTMLGAALGRGINRKCVRCDESLAQQYVCPPRDLNINDASKW